MKQIDESGEVHLSDAIRKIRIPSEQWDEQGVTLYATEFRIWSMKDWKEQLVRFLFFNDRDILPDAGRISHDLKIHKPMPTSPYYKKKALFSSLFSVSESII